MSDKKYVVFRVYSEKERPGIRDNDRIVYYGWTSSKIIVKAFMKQRDNDKYVVKKLNDAKIEMMQIYPEIDTVIDFIRLPSKVYNTDVDIFMTKKEMKDAEKKISKFVHTSFSLEHIGTDKEHWRLLELFCNFEDKYQEALEYFGIWPDELNAVFDNIEYRESDDGIYDADYMIDASYDEEFDVPHETYTHSASIPGYKAMNVWKMTERLFYSAEAFIMVLKDDM